MMVDIDCRFRFLEKLLRRAQSVLPGIQRKVHGADNIRVNAVAPGVTRTDMVAALPKEMVDRLAAGIPLGRVGEPEEVADAFLFLASNMASYITGEILSVDGAVVI